MGELLLMRSRPTGRATGTAGAAGPVGRAALRTDVAVPAGPAAACVAVGGAVVPMADRVARAAGTGATPTARAGRSGRRDRTARYARLRRLRDRASASVRGDLGMATAEYAIATVAAAGFAGLLIAVLRSDEVRGMLAQIVRGALSL
ncbi:DUF4244 domain-containing protein [Cellulomonas carbonis]|uniref:DUF4244 domain-containing protein n=1 Tax=Cellulomonas carbonis TaxID=1386092 RepID=UPI0019952749|nr:DUF4244 domain-containing protein [Cellulomonas carbonis]GGC04354.1 hypothetical protein GCM10010972_16920 [Cellulomonas carbonis]